MRKNPVKPIKYFFPSDEVNICFQVINQRVEKFQMSKFMNYELRIMNYELRIKIILGDHHIYEIKFLQD